ncbi:sulfatase [Pelomonas sp. SE-A7]|uniref:sulfatase family protein n=1 Tax=Pelomonas sp. SE-A7 TaxID=3054953 RepID=UPI00259D0757|nr:sulfatase [Pelomonas sp. SE-A7]MDM4767535.1 sulfatase [Pelomonas sp. SE-A7]
MNGDGVALAARGFWPRLWTAFAALGLVWMPLVLLRQIDAYVAFLTPMQLLRDAALAYVLLLLPAALLAAFGSLAAAALDRLARTAGRGGILAWALVLAPTLWVCLWQLGSSAWAWLRSLAGDAFAISPAMRVGAAVLLLALLAWLVRRFGLTRLMLRLVERLADLQRPAQGLLVVALVVVVMAPPTMLRTNPVATSTPGPARPDVYLITIDTLAEADARVCGEGPGLMPELQAFAASATCFSRAYSTSNFTTPSTSTLETGALPWTHWAVQIAAPVAAPLQDPSLARQLREVGYEAHSLNANLLASPRHHGTSASWDSAVITESDALGNLPRVALTRLGATTLPYWFSSLLPFLDTLDVYRQGDKHPYAAEHTYRALDPLLKQAGDKPRFVWLHTLPPHDPYLPPAVSKYKLLPRGELERWGDFRAMGDYAPAAQASIDKYRLRYRESIMGADAALGALLRQLKAQGRLDQALVIISSDHGESFERGFLGHAGERIHNAVLQVPLVIKLPGQTLARRVETPVSLADLAPTIADLAGAKALPYADGRSLRPALQGEGLENRPVFAMAMERQSRFQTISQGHYALILGDHKLVHHLAEQRSELFNLKRDPTELQDLSASEPALAAQLLQTLRGHLASAEQRRDRLVAEP